MPTYQYACTNAEGKHEFEVVQSFTDPAVTTCPECGAPVRKVYGSVGVVFKGSGFYRTDSRPSETSSAPAASATKESSASGSKETSSAPAAKNSSSSAPAASSPSSSKAAN